MQRLNHHFAGHSPTSGACAYRRQFVSILRDASSCLSQSRARARRVDPTVVPSMLVTHRHKLSLPSSSNQLRPTASSSTRFVFRQARHLNLFSLLAFECSPIGSREFHPFSHACARKRTPRYDVSALFGDVPGAAERNASADLVRNFVRVPELGQELVDCSALKSRRSLRSGSV